MTTLNEKFLAFEGLHRRQGAFVIPNPWNAGSAKILEQFGFEALATTSAGLAFSSGFVDGAGEVSRTEILANASQIVSATRLPVSADLENGFGADPEECAETIRLASSTGLVGGSIEDATGNTSSPIYDFSVAVERIHAAAEASSGLPFILTARSENHLHGRGDLDDTIKRLQAFEKAGADVLYAPGLPDLNSIRLVCQSVSKPVNVVMGLSGPSWSVDELRNAGVKRISVGGSFARAALGALMRAAREVRDHGTFSYARHALPDSEARQIMSADRSRS